MIRTLFLASSPILVHVDLENSLERDREREKSRADIRKKGRKRPVSSKKEALGGVVGGERVVLSGTPPEAVAQSQLGLERIVLL